MRSDDVDRRYLCGKCDGVVRARWYGPGSFAVGCHCTTVPVVPQMRQSDTPDCWGVERPACCSGMETTDMEVVYVDGADYRCPDCGATYGWDGQMVDPPKGVEELDDEQQTIVEVDNAD